MKTNLIVCTDGSFSPKEGNCHGGGFITAEENDSFIPFALMTTLPDWVRMRNIGGEVLAAVLALTQIEKMCNDNPDTYYSVTFIYDYEGVEKWVTGAWQAKNKYTAWYAAVMRSIINRSNGRINIEWKHCKSHTGDFGNELADQIAHFDMTFCKANGITVQNLDKYLMETIR